MTVYTEILIRCKKHDRRAQMMFYERFHYIVYRSAFRLLGQTGEAEEVMQEVLLKALERIADADEDEPVIEWRLRRMAVNASIDLLRKRKHAFLPVDENLDAFPEDEPEEALEAEWRAECLKQAVERLPQGYRTIVNLRLLEELPFEEIAGLLNITSSTARSQFTRAKQKLIQLIKTEYVETRE